LFRKKKGGVVPRKARDRKKKKKTGVATPRKGGARKNAGQRRDRSTLGKERRRGDLGEKGGGKDDGSHVVKKV